MSVAGAELYKEVKRATDSSLGIPSQCFVANKAGIQRGPPAKPRVQYCAKCALSQGIFIRYEQMQPLGVLLCLDII